MALIHKLVARLDLTPPSLRLVATYYLSYVALGVVTPSLGTALPFLVERTGVSMDLASSMFSARALGFMLGSFVTARVLARFPAHGAIQSALVVMALALVAMSMAPGFILLLLILAILGFFGSWLDIGSNILMIGHLGARVPPFLTGLHFIFGVGALITPLIIVQLQLRTGTLWAPFAVIALIVAVCALLYIRLPSPPPASTAAVQGARMPKVPLATLIVMLFLAGTMEMAVGGFAFSYLLTTDLFSTQRAGGVISTFYAAFTCTRLVTVFLLMRFSSQMVVTAAMALLLGAVMAILWLPATPTLLWIAILFCGIGVSVPFPLALALAPQYIAAADKATARMFSGVSVGALSMPLLIGRLFDSPAVGPQVIWYYLMMGAILCMGCVLVLHFVPRLTLARAPGPQPQPVAD